MSATVKAKEYFNLVEEFAMYLKENKYTLSIVNYQTRRQEFVKGGRFSQGAPFTYMISSSGICH